MHSIQQQMAQEFIDKICRQVSTTDLELRGGTVVILPDGQHLAEVRFHVERRSRRRYIVHAYAIPGIPLPDPLGRFSRRAGESSEDWVCAVDPADDADVSYIIRVLEGLYDMKRARILSN